MKYTYYITILSLLLFANSYSQEYKKIKIPTINPQENTGNYTFENNFALVDQNTKDFFKKFITVKNKDKNNTTIRNLDAGSIVFFDTNTSKITPTPEQKNIIVIENKNKTRFYYTNVYLDTDLCKRSLKTIKENTIIGSYINSFNLLTSQDSIFYHPYLFLKPAQNDTDAHKFTLSSVLLESGIYSKFITEKTKKIRIPFRKHYIINVYAFEQKKGSYHKSLPRTISIKIINTTSQDQIFSYNMNLTDIQKNLLNNQWNPEVLYRKYSTINMIRTANWENLERTEEYTITVTATNFDENQDSLTFTVEFY